MMLKIILIAAAYLLALGFLAAVYRPTLPHIGGAFSPPATMADKFHSLCARFAIPAGVLLAVIGGAMICAHVFFAPVYSAIA